MIRNYFKIAWRNLIASKSYAVVNVFGLTVGIAACITIFSVIYFENSYDKFHQNKDRIYRVISTFKTPQGLNYDSGVPFPTEQALQLDFPQLPLVASLFNNPGQISVHEGNKGAFEKKFQEKNIFFSNTQFFDMFDFRWVAGNKHAALKEPNTVILTKNIASKYFGSWQNAIGKTLLYQNKNILKVTGILDNLPVNTDLPVEIVISYATLKNTDIKRNLQDWTSIFGDHYCFIEFPPNLRPEQFERQLTGFINKYKPKEYVNAGMTIQALTEMHYDPKVGVFSKHTFSKDLSKALTAIGLFLLIIACVNFVNLATAQAVNRSKEIGMRKVLGSSRLQLVFQFLTETFLITFFAVLFSLVIFIIAIPYINRLLESQITLAFLTTPMIFLFLIGVILLVTLLSGFYPAIVLSGFNPVKALQTKTSVVPKTNISLRRFLLVLQFCIAQILIIGTLVIVWQMDFVKNKSLGFDKDAIVTVPIPGDSLRNSKLNSLRSELLKVPGIKAVSYSFATPSDNTSWSTDLKFNNSPKKTDFGATLKWADVDYFKLYNISFVAGRPYFKSDSVREYVVNETFLRKLGIRDPNQAIGKYINLWDDKTKYAPISGVVKDFNTRSLNKAIPAVVMSSWSDLYQVLNIKLEGSNIPNTLPAIEKTWKDVFPNFVYSYQFLDEKIAEFYKDDQRLSTLYKIFAGIAIFISCLGLYGLVSQMAAQRIREVAIRKTLGASITNIVFLFSKEFILLIILSFVIATPISWRLMHSWLQSFEYRIGLGPFLFTATLAISLIVAGSTVGLKIIKVANTNPIKSLRGN